jgi:hypothetical protein
MHGTITRLSLHSSVLIIFISVFLFDFGVLYLSFMNLERKCRASSHHGHVTNGNHRRIFEDNNYDLFINEYSCV